MYLRSPNRQCGQSRFQVLGIAAPVCVLLVVALHLSAARMIRQDGNTVVEDVQLTFYDGKNLNGQLLIIDVNSIQFKGNHPYFYGMSGPDTASKYKCAEICAHTTGCNAFVSCERPEGCGAGCKAYVAANPSLGDPGFDSMNYDTRALPLTGFGVWTYPAYNLDGCANTTSDYSGVTGDKFPWGFCSLKQVTQDEVQNPQFWADSDGFPQYEFSSGVLMQPANCPQDLPYSICGRCNALGAGDKVAACLECASSFKVYNPIKEAVGSYDETYDYCPKCFADGKDPESCIQCLKDNANGGEVYNC